MFVAGLFVVITRKVTRVPILVLTGMCAMSLFFGYSVGIVTVISVLHAFLSITLNLYSCYYSGDTY